jgi:hypothetical protein
MRLTPRTFCVAMTAGPPGGRGDRRFGVDLVYARIYWTLRRRATDEIAIGEVDLSVTAMLHKDRADRDKLLQRSVHSVP